VLLVFVAALISGCADGFSVGVLVIPNPIKGGEVYGLTGSLIWNFEKGVKTDNGTENIQDETSGPGSGTWSGSVSSQGTAEGLANQHRGKGQGKAGTDVETEKTEETEESEKAYKEQSRQSLSFKEVGCSVCKRPSGQKSAWRLYDLQKRQSESCRVWLLVKPKKRRS